MSEVVQQMLHGTAGQPWAWASIAVAAAPVCREGLRRLAFLCGLLIVVRGATGRDRVAAIEAYGRCAAAAETWRPARRGRSKARTGPE